MTNLLIAFDRASDPCQRFVLDRLVAGKDSALRALQPPFAIKRRTAPETLTARKPAED